MPPDSVARDRSIVEALAAAPAPIDSGDCCFCDEHTGGYGTPNRHTPDCPWRRAREAYPDKAPT